LSRTANFDEVLDEVLDKVFEFESFGTSSSEAMPQTFDFSAVRFPWLGQSPFFSTPR
jgi:hypothetical protein